MQKFRKILILLFATAILFTLVSCKKECKNHFDTSGDGLCEECGKAADKKQDDTQKVSLTIAEGASSNISLYAAQI